MDEHSHESNPPISVWPFLLAIGITLMVSGVVTSLIVSLVGVVFLLVALGGWIQETRLFGQDEADSEEEAHHE